MTYDFFADNEDRVAILNYIFEESDLQIFDLDSAPGENIQEYKSVAEIGRCFDLENEPGRMTFQLWSPEFKVKPLFKKVALNPKYCKGHTFRFSTQGWGLIQLYFGAIGTYGLQHSHFGHFNQKGALKWESIHTEKGAVDLWDWKIIQKRSNQLKYALDKKMSVKRIGSCGVLAGAYQLEQQGVKLIW